MQSSIEASLLKNVGNRLNNIGLDLNGLTFLIGVSGGSDSMALVSILNKLKDSLGFDIYMAHLDHGLRQDSSEDAKFVTKFSDSLGIPCTVGKEDVETHRRANGLTLEEAARQLRYRFLVSVAGNVGASAVVVGHTSDDQIETILMNIIRGGGITGLLGMSDVRNSIAMGIESDIDIIRPLLGVSKSDTEEYCNSIGIQYLQDPSNSSLDHTRNRIRLELIPHLLKFNPKVGKNLLKLSDSARHDLDFISDEAFRQYESLLLNYEGGIRIDKHGFCNMHISLQNHMLRLMYANLAGSPAGLEYQHIQDMIKIAYGGAGLQIHLPNGFVFWTDYDYLALDNKGKSMSDRRILFGEHLLAIPGSIVVPGWDVNCDIVDGIDSFSGINKYVAHFDRDRLGNKLIVRSRRYGDKFHPFGMNGSKTVDKFFSDSKIPSSDRDMVPILISDNGIIWIVGHRTDNWSVVSVHTKEIVRLTFSSNHTT